MEVLLRLGHDTHLLYLPHFMFSLPDLGAMRQHWKERLHVASSPWAWLPGAVRNAFLTRRERVLERLGALRPSGEGSADYDRLVDARWASEAEELCQRYRFDAVMVEYVMLSSVLRGITGPVLRIIDTHDVFAEREERISHIPERVNWFVTTRQGEALGLNRADVVLAIQEQEADYFRELTRNPVVTVGHLLDAIRPAGEPGGEPSVLMIASRNAINRHGLQVFLEKSWPVIRDAVPDAKLRLVGNIGNVMAGDWPGLERLGVVENLLRAYQQGHVAINPVLEGTGLPIKSIEALAWGKPLVTTPSGARGIEDGTGSAFLMGSTPPEFAAAVVRLLRDPRHRQTLTGAAIRYALAWNDRQIRNLQKAVSTVAPALPRKPRG